MSAPYSTFYEDDLVTLYRGRWEDVLPTLGHFDLIFTSPPYNLGGSPWPHLGHWKPGDGAGGKSKWRNGSDGSGGVTYTEHEETCGAYCADDDRCECPDSCHAAQALANSVPFEPSREAGRS